MPSDVAEGYDSVAMWTYLPLGCSPARVECTGSMHVMTKQGCHSLAIRKTVDIAQRTCMATLL